MPTALYRGKQADRGMCVSRRAVLSAPLAFGIQLARLRMGTWGIKCRNAVPFPSSAVTEERPSF